MQSLKRLQLVRDPSGERSDGDVADVSKQVLNTNLLCFLGLDGGWGVYKGLGRSGAVLYYVPS